MWHNKLQIKSYQSHFAANIRLQTSTIHMYIYIDLCIDACMDGRVAAVFGVTSGNLAGQTL